LNIKDSRWRLHRRRFTEQEEEEEEEEEEGQWQIFN